MTDKSRARTSSPANAFRLGGLYSFAARAGHKPGAALSGRHAAVKIIGLDDQYACFVVLDGMFAARPSLSDVEHLPPLHQLRFIFNGQIASLKVPLEWDVDLDDFTLLGVRDVTAEEAKLSSDCRSFSTWSSASSFAESEWRWHNDRETFEAETAREREANIAYTEAARERYRMRLKSLTLAQLLAERQFERWHPHPPFPPAEFVERVRARMRAAMVELQALGARPRKAAVRGVLKVTVEWLNALDAEFGGVIETEEREDLHAVLEELAYAAKQGALAGEIELWRQW